MIGDPSKNEWRSGVLVLFENRIGKTVTALHVSELGKKQVAVEGWAANDA